MDAHDLKDDELHEKRMARMARDRAVIEAAKAFIDNCPLDESETRFHTEHTAHAEFQDLVKAVEAHNAAERR